MSKKGMIRRRRRKKKIMTNMRIITSLSMLCIKLLGCLKDSEMFIVHFALNHLGYRFESCALYSLNDT